MFRRLLQSLLLAVLLVPGVAAAPAVITPSEQRSASHWIILDDGKKPTVLAESAGCSATAVAPHILLSAHHCYVPDSKLYLDGGLVGYSFTAIFDKNDTALFVVPEATFKNVVPFAVREGDLKQGDVVHIFGNPAGVHDIYREGYIGGKTDLKDSELKSIWVVVMPTVGGDSGSAVWDAEGHICGVVTYGIFGGKMMGFAPPVFTEKQLAEVGL